MKTEVKMKARFPILTRFPMSKGVLQGWENSGGRGRPESRLARLHTRTKEGSIQKHAPDSVTSREQTCNNRREGLKRYTRNLGKRTIVLISTERVLLQD